jgi:hypothetical protein
LCTLRKCSAPELEIKDEGAVVKDEGAVVKDDEEGNI